MTTFRIITWIILATIMTGGTVWIVVIIIKVSDFLGARKKRIDRIGQY